MVAIGSIFGVILKVIWVPCRVVVLMVKVLLRTGLFESRCMACKFLWVVLMINPVWFVRLSGRFRLLIVGM